MANERDRMTDEPDSDDSMRGGTGDRQGGEVRRDESSERLGDEPNAERMRGTGDELDDEEFEATDETDEEDQEEEDGTI